jgi:hypothetical protein
MEYLPKIIINVFIPLAAGIMFFALARYVRYIGPLRQFAAGKQTYDSAYWGFIAFGIYLATRPLQILLGPHPMPLIVNNVREFFMIGVFGPAIFVAIYGLAFGGENIKKRLTYSAFGAGIALAAAFAVINVYAIGGSEEIFSIGSYPAYDGLWFDKMTPERARLMTLLFAIRLADPVILLCTAATIALVRAFNYPDERKKLYDNMPKKLVLTAIGTYFYALSMLIVGFIWLLGKIPNQWWGYYIGALFAGLFEAWSIALPLRKDVL